MTIEHDDSDETTEDVQRAWVKGQPFEGAVCAAKPAHYIDPAHLAQAREQWAERVAAILDTPIGEVIPEGDVVIPVLASDILGTFMAQIEDADRVTLAIDGAFEFDADGNPGTVHELTLIRLSRSAEDPFEWVLDDNFAGCEFRYDWMMVQIALSGFSICTNCFWATETDEPAAWDMAVLWPSGFGAAEDSGSERVQTAS